MCGRISDYPDVYAGRNVVASIGSYISYASSLFFVFVVLHNLFGGRRVGTNPWGEGATTLAPLPRGAAGPTVTWATRYCAAWPGAETRRSKSWRSSSSSGGSLWPNRSNSSS